MSTSATLHYLVLLALTVARATAGQELHFDRQTPVVAVYAKTQGAVVNISGERTVAQGGWTPFDWPAPFSRRGPSFRRQVPVLGSGFVLHEDGFIVTNAHVVDGVERIKAVFNDGREYQARLVSAAVDKDLAVLAVDTPQKLPFVELGRSNDLMIGETVIAIGNPYGYANTVTSGVVSATGRDLQVTEGFWLRGLIQTDASINPGNSGGPLLNINGQLIGINTAIRGDAENIGFAIPVDTLVENLSQMLMPEKLRRVRLGLTMGRMKTDRQFRGLVIDGVGKSSPAQQKGLQAGDLVLRMDGRPLHSVIDFYVQMMHKQIGEPIELQCVFNRGVRQELQTVRLTLLSRPLPDGRRLARQYFQMDISPLTAPVARRFDFEGAYPVLIVTAVEANGTAAHAGVRSGDLLLQINGATVRGETEFARTMETLGNEAAVEFRILRITMGLFGQIDRHLRIAVPLNHPPAF